MPSPQPRDAQTPVGARLLLLSPSAGLGGGIERVMDAVEAQWQGPVHRVNLVDASRGGDTNRADEAVTPLEIVRFAGRAMRAVRAARPDVVVCGLLGLLPVASVVGLMARRRVALLAYGVDVWGPIGPLERTLARRCSPLVAISAYTAEAFGARIGVDSRRIKVIALPMAEVIAKAASDSADRHVAGPALILTVSRLARSDRFKGHFTIARSFGRVLERHAGARWVVVGDGDDLHALRAECRDLGIEKSVTFAGQVSDDELIEHYRRATMFVLPSFADADADPPVGEGFGIVYVEAGAFGLPIIAATAGGGSAEFVVDGQTALTVPAGGPDGLSDAIVRLLDDESLRTRLGQNARTRAFGRHLPAHFGEALRRLLV